jgi:hypothetical protein
VEIKKFLPGLLLSLVFVGAFLLGINSLNFGQGAVQAEPAVQTGPRSTSLAPDPVTTAPAQIATTPPQVTTPEPAPVVTAPIAATNELIVVDQPVAEDTVVVNTGKAQPKEQEKEKDSREKGKGQEKEKHEEEDDD